MSEPAERVAEHWGVMDADLLYDERRYTAYALAHHVAGHAWALWRLGEASGPLGLCLALPVRLNRATAAEVEATAVLIEVLAHEYVRDLWRLADFGLTGDDVDWNAVRDITGSVWRNAVWRGCRTSSMESSFALGNEEWNQQTAWYALREWDEIAGLADRIGRGQVLEADEVDRVLRWW